MAGRLSLKPDVEIRDLDPRLVETVPAVCRVFGAFDYDATVTSGRDGEHKAGSLHYKGRALDWRRYHLAEGVAELLVEELRRELGPDFDVVLEATHIHIELDPKG